MRKAIAASLGAAVLGLTAAAPAQALIRVQKGMAGVTIGMTQDEMRAKLGTPQRVKQGLNDFGPYTQFSYAHAITVTFQGNRHVTGISTRGRSERTTRGIGVGSVEDDVRAKVAHVRCETLSGVRLCHVGSFDAGRRVTVFRMDSRGRVVTVTVSIVID